VAVGALAGLVLGGAVAAWRAHTAGLPALASAGAAVREAAPAVLAGGAVAAVVVGVTLAWSAGTAAATGARAAWRAVDLTVLAGLAVAGLALARGSVTAGALAERTDPLLLALPVIVVVCGGLLVARAWPALTGAAARLVPHGRLALRLGLLGALRRPLRPVATVAFLAAATGIVVFAGAYRATLAQGAVDQAAFAVPLDARITTGANLERPLEVASPAGFAATAPGVAVYPVLRAAAGVRRSADESTTAEVVGVDPGALTRVRSWANAVGTPDAADAARRIAVPRTGPAPGITVPAGTRELAFGVRGDVAQVAFTAWLRAGDGRDVGLVLHPDGGRLVAAVPAGLVPAGSAPARLFALALAESIDYATHHQHRIGEGTTDAEVLAGRVVLGPPASGGDWTGWGSGNADAAATGGLLQLVVNGNEPIPARVAGVLARFPTTGTRFVVADAGALADALDTREPGTGGVGELWLSAPPGQAGALARALSAAPYDRLGVDLRQAREDRLAGDPVARGAGGLLAWSALLAMLVAVVAVVLLVVAERRDESAELYAWESDGVAPATLRGSLFARAAAVVAVAVPGGLAVGLLLSALTTALVTVTAVGGTPNPPLALATGTGWLAGVLAAGVALGLAASGAVAFSALREPLPRRPPEELA
jgi:hypothetical protein